jgi:hypothetical protein
MAVVVTGVTGTVVVMVTGGVAMMTGTAMAVTGTGDMITGRTQVPAALLAV